MEDLDAFLEIYNTRRPHRGRSMEGRTPYEIFTREIHRKREDRKPPAQKEMEGAAWNLTSTTPGVR